MSILKEIKLKDIVINGENKRIAPKIETSVENQKLIIKSHLYSEEEAVDKYIQLAISIAEEKEVTESIILFYDKKIEKYIVVEGNRRVIACLLLKEKSLIPSYSEKLKATQFDIDENFKLPANIFESYEKAIRAADRTNPDSKDGASKTGWDYLTETYHNGKGVAANLLRYILDDCGIEFSKLKNKQFSRESFNELFKPANLKLFNIKFEKSIIKSGQKGNIQEIFNNLLNSGLFFTVTYIRSNIDNILKAAKISEIKQKNSKTLKKKKELKKEFSLIQPSFLKKIPKNTKLHEMIDQISQFNLTRKNYYLIGASIRAILEIFLSSFKCNSNNLKSSIKIKAEKAFENYFKKPTQTKKNSFDLFLKNIDTMHSFLHDFEHRISFEDARSAINSFVDMLHSFMRQEVEFSYG